MTRRCGYCGEPLDRDGRCPRLATSLDDLLERGGEPLRPVTYVARTVGWAEPIAVAQALRASARRAESEVAFQQRGAAFCVECGAEVRDPSEEGSTYESIRAGTECRCVVDRSKMSFEDFLAWSAEEIERAKRRRE